MDLWDHKPMLEKYHGTPLPGAEKEVTFQGKNGNLMKSPWAFAPSGQGGKMISSMLPHMAKHVDDMASEHAATHPGNDELHARMAAYELAAKMQLTAPEVSDLASEPQHVHEHYGTSDSNKLKAAYAKNCLLARRFLEQGVRYVSLYCASRASAVDGLLNWDAHKTLKADYERHCPIFDQPTAALLTDLKQRGMLNEAFTAATKPRSAELKKLEAERDKLADAIEARARDAFAKVKPTRPKIDLQGTDETFDPVEARYLKFVIQSFTGDYQTAPKNKRLTGQGKLTEFQVWSAEQPERNVALASNGTTAEGAKFATAIVDTPSDFGFLGSKPTHPELLDYLASRLVANGWKLKALHREILLSKTYQQSATYREDAAQEDKDARLLWRFPPRRLSAEELRDTMLAVAGKLQLEPIGGPGFRLYRYLANNVSTYLPLDTHGPETYRRAVYHQNARASVVDVLNDFDLPDIAFAAPKRANTTTPLQALTLLNHSFTLDMAKALVVRIQDGDAVTQACHFAFQREPTLKEREASKKLISTHGPEAFCRALLNANELIYLE